MNFSVASVRFFAAIVLAVLAIQSPAGIPSRETPRPTDRPLNQPARAKLSRDYGNLPLAFEPNVGRVIYTDMGAAELVYRARVTDTTMWDPMFVSAFAYLLASEICLPLSVNPAVAQQARQAYGQVSSSAAARNMSEGAEGPEPPSELIATRNMAVPFSRDSWPYYG